MNSSPRRTCGLLRCGIVTILSISFASIAWSADTRHNPLRETTTPRRATEADDAVATAEPPARESQPQSAATSRVEFAVAEVPTGSGARVRQTSNSIRVRQQPYTPAHESVVESDVMGGQPMIGEVLPPGMPGPVLPGDILMEHGHGEIAFDSCGSCKGKGCVDCCLLPCPNLPLDNVEVFVGAQGFTGPLNRGGSGSFGFHEGANWGLPLPGSHGWMGMQLGVRATQSNLSGAGFPFDGTATVNSSTFTTDTRNQIFVTGGLFRRVDWGLQGGVVLDYLSDNWYTNPNLLQVRGEASWVFPNVHEFGFWFTASTRTEERISSFTGTMATALEEWEATDMYAFFYRHRSAAIAGAECRIFAGWTGHSDGLIGIDYRLPLSENFALESGFSYLIPQESNTGTFGGGHEEESWNLAMSLVWYPGACTAFGGDYYRPLFNVADNGSFRVDRVR